MKLELNHISGYLGFNLEIKQRPFSGTEKLKTKHLKDKSFKDVIPILRPISDLTKEIYYNGEKIIPIVEIIKTVSLIDLSDCCFDVFFEDGHYSVNAELKSRTRVVDCIYFDGNIFFTQNNSGDFSPLNPQLEAYEMLDKYHFDWKYDLIGKDLAIDINTLS